MSGEDGAAGYIFQYNVILQVALEVWGADQGSDVAALLVEGKPGQQAVDYTIVAEDGDHRVVSQVKKRRTQRAFSAREIIDAIVALDQAGGDGRNQLEFVTNGRVGPSGQKLIALLGRAPDLNDEQITDNLIDAGLSDLLSQNVICALRRTAVTLRPAPVEELRARVADGLSALRGRSGFPVGREAAELLRSKLFELLTAKSDDGTRDRRLTHEEFLKAVSTSKKTLEEAHGARWGALTGMSDRQHAVRRPGLLHSIANFLQDSDGLHSPGETTATCVLTGRAGAGKTTLAQQYALEHAAEFDVIYQISAEGGAEPMSSESLVAREFERFARWLNRKAGTEIPVEQCDTPLALASEIQNVLGSWPRRWLLLLDNVTDYRFVAKYLPANGYGVVLVTTRNSGWAGSFPKILVDAMTEEEATRLVRSHLPEGPGPASGDHVRKLLDQLERFPLGLSTAAAFLKRTGESVDQFLARLVEEKMRVSTLSRERGRPEDYPVPAVAALQLSLRHVEAQAKHDDAAVCALSMLERGSVLFSEQIPLTLLSQDFGASEAVAVLRELSLVRRWYDRDGNDWIRLHHLLQDVVRVELVEADRHGQLLGEVQSDLTELIHECVQNKDFSLGSVLRSNGIVVTDHIRRYGVAAWSDTVALLSNTAVLAGVAGDLAGAEELYKQALAIAPHDDLDPRKAIRRAKTLLGYGDLLMARQRYVEARDVLHQAKSFAGRHVEWAIHADLLRQINTCLVLCEAETTIDQEELHRLLQELDFVTAHNQELHEQVCAARMSVASKLQWQPGSNRDLLRRAAEDMLTLVRFTKHVDPRKHAQAHLLLAEAHAGAGEKTAAYSHYKVACEILTSIKGVAADIILSHIIDLAWAMTILAFDFDSGYLYPTADSFLSELLEDIDRELTSCESAGHRCDYLRIRWTCLRIIHASHHGHVNHVEELIKDVRQCRDECRESIPEITYQWIDSVQGYVDLACKVSKFRGIIGGVLIAPESNEASVTDTDYICAHFTNAPDANFDDQQVPVKTSKQMWDASALHAELLHAWLVDATTALRDATAKVWQAPLLREIHVAGALQILTLLIDRYVGYTVPGSTRRKVCKMLESEARLLHDDQGVEISGALNLLATLQDGDGIIDLPPFRHIRSEQDLLHSVLTVETALLTVVATGEKCDAAVLADRLRIVAKFESDKTQE